MIPLKDNGVTHVGVEWGGTAVRANATPEIIRDYINSAVRFKKIAADAKADVLFTNHSAHDHTMEKLAALKARAPGAPHPFVLGPQGIDRYLTVESIGPERERVLEREPPLLAQRAARIAAHGCNRRGIAKARARDDAHDVGSRRYARWPSQA